MQSDGHLETQHYVAAGGPVRPFAHTPSLVRFVALTMVLTVLVGPATALAVPTNEHIEDAKGAAARARERLDDLAAELEERSEDYLEIEAEIEVTRQRIAEAHAELSRARARKDEAEARLNRRASVMYKMGPVEFVEVLVGATSFRDLVTRLDLMRMVGRSDAVLVRDVKEAKRAVETAVAALERRRAEQAVLRDRARVAKRQADAAYERQKSYLAKLDATVRRLIAEERRRQDELARRRAEEARRRAAAAVAAGGIGRGGRVFDPSALGESRTRVVGISRRYVGKTPYVWGGTTPDGFDCSGLVQYCYREIGIGLPRTSRQQYRVGAYIPPERLDLLEPGDLVFFGRNGDPGRIHHVAIYSGEGRMIHAPQTGELVSEGSLLARIESRGDYVGAVRP